MGVAFQLGDTTGWAEEKAIGMENGTTNLGDLGSPKEMSKRKSGTQAGFEQC